MTDIYVNNLMNTITDKLIHTLNENLVGIYLHGSAAFGCFNPDKSDVDFIVVTEAEPDFDQKRKIISFLLEIDSMAPAKGLEMSIVLKEHCHHFVYPTPYCLHFSNYYKEKYMQDIDGHIRKLHGTDKDLAAHFTVISTVGVTWYGKDKKEVFSPVPKEYYLDSIINDISDAVEDISANPVYFILNLCRVYAYIADNIILSKEQGGLWGIKNIPQYKSIIETAVESYKNSYNQDFNHRQLVEFAGFMTNRISADRL